MKKINSEKSKSDTKRLFSKIGGCDKLINILAHLKS